MSLRSPLARARGLGSAKSGSHHWIMQRITAIALVPLSVWFTVSLITLLGADYQSIVAWIKSPLESALLLMFIWALFHHAQLGIQVVVEDYVSSEWRKLSLLVFIQFVIILLGLASTVAVLKIAFGVS